MKLGDYLAEGIKVMVFKYPDGSEVKYATTTNKELLEGMGFNNKEGLIDLSTGEAIPNSILKYFNRLEDTAEIKYRNPLDAIFDKGAKIKW